MSDVEGDSDSSCKMPMKRAYGSRKVTSWQREVDGKGGDVGPCVASLEEAEYDGEL